MPDLALTVLDDLAVLGARGADVLPFLNGQLSQDMNQLPARRAMFAGLHTPQGRCTALVRLLHLDDAHVLLVLSQALAEGVRAQLQRFVFRSRVRVEDGAAAWGVYGLEGPDAEAACSTRLHMPLDTAGMRQLVVAPHGEPLPQSEPAPRAHWRAADIAAGIPELTPATAGLWVAQMLNLDLLDAVSFQKGCYTGQEVIARAHFRGQVKRRMQRFFTSADAPLPPGARVRLQDGRVAQVVTSGETEQGREFLAVAPLGMSSPVAEDSTPEAAPLATIAASVLPLPYTLPG